RHQILGLLCFLSFLNSSLPWASPLCPRDQRDALLQIKDSFVLDSKASNFFCDKHVGFTSYPKTNSWSKGMDCCLWDGVTYDGITGNVICLDLSCSWLRHLLSLNLAYNGFFGTCIWPNLSTLSELTHLNLSGSYLSGTVPSEISRLSKLESLDLSEFFFFFFLTTLDISLNVNLFGILPKSNWTSPLVSLDLKQTNFLGEIPNSIGNMKSLAVLDIQLCKFTGYIPLANDFSGVIGLETSTDARGKYIFPKLEVLGLSSVNLTKFPPFLNSSKKLRILDLSLNRISGEIPRWFWVISHDTLEYLDLSGNLLKGGIQQLHGKRLLHIDLWNNSFQQFPILPPSTIYFDASKNGFKEIPSSICQNKLQGSLPRSLVKCSSLSILDLSHNEFNDIFPHWLQAPLGGLNLQSNKFHGRINVFLNTSLAMIDLSNNKFGGPIPLPSPVTYYYSIASNNVMRKIPSLLCNATELRIIDFSNNSLIGSLPWCLTSFSMDLSVLQLRMNYLEGTIPQSFSLRNSLMTLDLSRNHFEGTLPQSLVKCTNLQVLDLSDNWIEDDVIGDLQSLIGLNLSHNHLTGFIPPTLGNLSNLGWLDLSFNKLSGEIPRVLGDLAFLGLLNLSKNQLTRRIPQDKHLSTFSSNSFSGNLGLCGTPLPKACPGEDIQPPLPSSSSTSNYEGHERWFEQKAMWIGYASGIIIRVSIAYIAFETGRPKWLTRAKVEDHQIPWTMKLF
ncbi:hypothetical protein EUGRSUZ_F00608, partial [Eucalyptus grandis]